MPILGVCLGSQLLAEAAGACPHRIPEPEIGWYDIEITEAGAADPLLGPLAPSVELFEWHHYAAPLPPGAVELARTPACVQAFRIEGKPAWGLQFHAEVTRENLWSWLDGWETPRPRRPRSIRSASAPPANSALRSRTRSGGNRGAVLGRGRPRRRPLTSSVE